jgi:hypothetical protein
MFNSKNSICKDRGSVSFYAHNRYDVNNIIVLCMMFDFLDILRLMLFNIRYSVLNLRKYDMTNSIDLIITYCRSYEFYCPFILLILFENPHKTYALYAAIDYFSQSTKFDAMSLNFGSYSTPTETYKN